MRVAVAGELLPLRIEGLELRRGHRCVLGRIEASTELAGHVREPLEQRKALVRLDGKVERQRNARLGKAHHAGRRHIAEDLEHGKEAGKAGFGDLFEDRDGAFAGMLPRNDVLELKQAAFAVHAVPVQDLVERIEERLVVLQRDDALVDLLVEEERVEEADREMIEREAGSIEGKDQLRLGRGLQLVPLRRVVALHEDSAGEVLAGRGAVDPAHGVLDVLALPREVEELVDAVELDALVVDQARDDGLEPQLRPGDQPGEAKAADGCGVEVRVLGGRAELARAVGADQLELRDVTAEGSGDVVVLAVNVVGDGSAEGHILCSRRDGKKEAARNGEVEDLRQRDAGLGGEQAGLGIEGDQAVHARGHQQVAALEQADIAIAASHADRQHAVVHPAGDRRIVALPVQRNDVRVVVRVAAPGLKGRLTRELFVRGAEVQFRRCSWSGGHGLCV